VGGGLGWRGEELRGVGRGGGGACLLAVVAALHHDGVGQALDDGALSLAEALLLPPAGGVREERHGLRGVRMRGGGGWAGGGGGGGGCACLSMAM